MQTKLITHLCTVIRDATCKHFALHSVTSVGGGSINAAYQLTGEDGTRYFLKLNDAHHLPMFVAEVDGLNTIAVTNTIRVPQPIAHGISDKQSYLVLEYLELNSHGDEKLLGEQLAALHHCTAKNFGYAHNNFIGTTTQANGWKDSWLDFWREQRLSFQLRLAAQNGHSGQLHTLGEKLLHALPVFFAGYTPQAALLHGDLWSGNHAFLADGSPTIFDPAIYYGDRECDLAMTELFGGYSANFYAAYRTAYPVDAGYAVRRNLYNLYHILNHANLFGGGYAQQAAQMMRRLLAETAG